MELRARCAVAHKLFVTVVFTAVFLTGCSGGGGGGNDGQLQRGGLDSANFGCSGDCPNTNLTAEDVTLILRQAVAGAELIGASATIAVIDRVGNVLGTYAMDGAPATSMIDTQTGASGGLEGASVPAVFCAISKAGTSAYFSSQANAFTTRTASQVIQENFNPGENFAPSGPLFGVQFSQTLCSDINLINPDFLAGVPIVDNPTATGLVGPRPYPLGFAGDPGTVPLYKSGDMVGAIGVEFDGLYTIVLKPEEIDDDDEERVALQGSRGFEAPSKRVANQLFVRGKSLRYTDVVYEDLAPLPAELPELDPAKIIAVPGFFGGGAVRAGATLGTPESGFVRTVRAGVEAEILVGGDGAVRFPSIDGTPLPGDVQLKAAEVEALLDAALLTADRTRAQVRRPRDSSARVAIWIVDTAGRVIGFVRSKDTILDSTDVTLQKARTAMFFSSADAGATLTAAGFGDYVAAADTLLGAGVFSGGIAWSTTALGNIARPFFPDGVTGAASGPFGNPFPASADVGPVVGSVFNFGLAQDLYLTAFLGPLSSPPVVPTSCTSAAFGGRIRNGVQFFPGGFPLYRGSTLIGGFASSGDGTEQDDIVPFFGASREGLDFAGYPDVGDPVNGFNAPPEIRADTIRITEPRTSLRYVVCPEAPFIGSNVQNVCNGK